MKRSVKRIFLAAELGLADAQFNLGLMYRKGKGVLQGSSDRAYVAQYRGSEWRCKRGKKERRTRGNNDAVTAGRGTKARTGVRDKALQGM